jgi:ubiquinone/menaquinone biosynthesis C-methylase UbiE
MGVKKNAQRRSTERMPDVAFRWMTRIFTIVDFFYPYIDQRVQDFGVREGMTVVDYGCGPGRYTTRLAALVGETGMVYAVDIHELAIEAVESKIARLGLQNVKPVLASGYDCGLEDGIADVVCALDMFFGVKDPTAFLGELKRIAKPDATLVIDDGHQSRQETKQKINASGYWRIVEESKDHLKCKPIYAVEG